MFKKIVLTSILLLTIGVLVFGAINRTQAKTESEVAGRGGPGRGLETGQSSPAQTEQRCRSAEHRKWLSRRRKCQRICIR